MMRTTLTVVALMALVAVGRADVENAGNNCITKSIGDTGGIPVTILPATVPPGQADATFQISNPCVNGKQGLTVTVCDPDATPDVTILSTDYVQVRRPQPWHAATLSGNVYCRP